MKFKSLVAAALLVASPVAAQEVKIGIAAEAYPPFASPDASGNWVGWEVEFINAMCAAGEMTCVITPVAWDGIIPSLTSGQIDVIMASMSITEERMQTISFSDKYYNTPTVVIGTKGVEMAPTAEGLAGKIISPNKTRRKLEAFKVVQRYPCLVRNRSGVFMGTLFGK